MRGRLAALGDRARYLIISSLTSLMESFFSGDFAVQPPPPETYANMIVFVRCAPWKRPAVTVPARVT